MKSLEEFIKENSSPVPKAPMGELDQILTQINRQQPWFKKLNWMQTFLVPAMTLALVMTITFSLQTPTRQINNDQLDSFITNSFDIYDQSAELALLE